MTYHMYYLLNKDRSVTPCGADEWTANHRPHKVAHWSMTNGDVEISTVFLGLNHAFHSGPPLIFETMVFTDVYPEINEDMHRYSTWDQALAGHKEMIDMVESYLLLHKSGLIEIEESAT